MADDAVYDAIVAFLKDPENTAVLADTVSPFAPPTFRYENEDFTIPPSQPLARWCSVSLSGVLYGQESTGASDQKDNRWDESGHLWVSVFVPVGVGGSRPRKLAKQIANLFRGLTLLDGALEFLNSFIGQGAPAEEEGNWFELPVMIEWRRTEA